MATKTKTVCKEVEVEIPDCDNCLKMVADVLQREIDYYETRHSDFEMLKGLKYAKEIIEREFLR